MTILRDSNDYRTMKLSWYRPIKDLTSLYRDKEDPVLKVDNKANLRKPPVKPLIRERA